MSSYDNYKETDKEWIGSVPSHWTPIPVKYYFYMKGRIGWQGLKSDEFKKEGPFLVTGTDFENGKVIWDRCYHITEERFAEDPAIHVKEHDLLVTKDGTVGKLAYIDEKPEKVSLNSHLLILRPYNRNVIYNKYTYWYLMSSVFRTYIGLKQTGSIMESLSQEKIGNFWIGLPPIEEQKAIAEFLDIKTAEIDLQKQNLLQQIELLKELKQATISNVVVRGINKDVELKASGVDEIGMIPSTWECVKLKRKAHIVRGGSPRPIESFLTTGNGYNWIKIGDAVKGSKYITRTEQRIISDGLKSTRLAHKGDLILSNSMSFGQPYILDIDGCIHDGWVAFSDFKEIDKEYLFYTLLSKSLKAQFEKSVDGSVVSNLNIDKVGTAFVPLPPIDEQIKIAAYLDAKVIEIDEQIALQEQQIQLIEELKQSIISQAVTGKIKVI